MFFYVPCPFITPAILTLPNLTVLALIKFVLSQYLPFPNLPSIDTSLLTWLFAIPLCPVSVSIKFSKTTFLIMCPTVVRLWLYTPQGSLKD